MLESQYRPLEVEEAIDDAYRSAEELRLFQEELEEAIEMIESLPYAVNRNGEYTEDQMVESLDGLFQLETLASRIRNNYGVELGAEERQVYAQKINNLEEMLHENAYKPAREHGTMKYSSEIS